MRNEHSPLAVDIDANRMRSARLAWVCLGALTFLAFSGTSEVGAQSLDLYEQQLPKKLVTIVDKTLDEQFSDIEEIAAKIPGMDRGQLFLITLPLENFIEDIIFPANRPVTVYPRVMLKVIHESFLQGLSKKKIASLLVRYQQTDRFHKIYSQDKKENS